MASTYPVVIEALDANKPTLTAGETGVLCSTQDTKKLYYWTGTGWTQIALATSGYKASFDNPPASPSAYDDEFTSTSLDAKWTIGSTGTTNPVTTGTVNPASSLTTPVYDLTTMPSWMLVQSDNSTASYVSIYQSLSPSTDATFFAKVGVQNRTVSGAEEGTVLIGLINTADTNEEVHIYLNVTGAGQRAAIQVRNNGVYTAVTGGSLTETLPSLNPYMALWKSGNTYHAGFGYGDGPLSHIGSVTKTGVTTFDRVFIHFYCANETPSLINGIDFFRYYPSLTYALMN